MLRVTAPMTILKRANDPREDALWDQVAAIAASLDGPLADAIEEAFVQVHRNADLEALERAITRGDLEEVLAVLGLDQFAGYMATARDYLRDALVAGARLEAPRINAAGTLAALYGGGTGAGRAAVHALGAAAVTSLYQQVSEAITEQYALGNLSPAIDPPGTPPAPPAGGGGGGFPPGGKPDFSPRAAVFQFDALNPKVVDFLQRYELDLIVEINDKTREAIRSIVTKGMQDGANPRDTARAVRQVVGLTDRQAAAVGAFRKQLETFHEKQSAQRMNLGGKISRAAGGAQTFAVDGSGKPIDQIFDRRLRDFRYDKTLQNAMDTGKPLSQAQIDKMVEAYARKYRRYRSEMIARTESVRATNAGTLASWKQAAGLGLVREELLRKTWIVAKDERTCPTCRPMPALNRGPEGFGILLTEQFNTGHGYGVQLPPLHPACRCVVAIRQIEPQQAVI